MPEFAEVYLQVEYLRDRCLGWTIEEYGVKGRSHFKGMRSMSEDERSGVLTDFFVGSRIENICQRGKQVILRLSKGTLLSHLMFKGRWSVAGDDFTSNYKQHKQPPTAKSNSFWLIADDGSRLNFHDPESMGHVSAYPGQSPGQIDKLKKLGKEVLSTKFSDPDFSEEWDLEGFLKKAGRSRKAIKAFLLDQGQQSGLGNMYVCEALYQAGLSPVTASRELSEEACEKLFEAAKDIVQRAIDTCLDYDEVLKIYRRETDPKGHKVETIKVSGRDTFWVPAVQK